MKQILLGIIYGFGIVIAIILAILWYQSNNEEVSTTSAVATSTQSSEADRQYAADLAKVNPNCVKYYETAGDGSDPISKELADFDGAYPLSDFLCGDKSDVASTTLADGKVLYFVDPITWGWCGSGGCPYFPLLEVKPGLVRHIRGFTWYDSRGSTQDTDGSVFGFLSFPKQNQVEVYWHESAKCGTTNTYTLNSKDEPVLISASDSCLPGKGILYPTK